MYHGQFESQRGMAVCEHGPQESSIQRHVPFNDILYAMAQAHTDVVSLPAAKECLVYRCCLGTSVASRTFLKV